MSESWSWTLFGTSERPSCLVTELFSAGAGRCAPPVPLYAEWIPTRIRRPARTWDVPSPALLYSELGAAFM
jgi:hypothetical protein